MKKLVLTAILLCLLCVSNSAKETYKDKPAKKENKTFVFPNRYSHWSIALGGGANFMMGDIHLYKKLSTNDCLKKCIDWSAKFQCEYMINPVWGVMIEYMYSAQNKQGLNYCQAEKNYPPTNSVNTNRDLQMHEVNFEIVVDWLNLVRMTRTFVEWNFYMGAGLGLLNFETCYGGNYKLNQTLIIPIFMSVEYTPTPALGIFLDTHFRWYASDEINGQKGGTMKDMSLYGGLGLRYHILQKDKPHVHCIDRNTYEPLRYKIQKDEDEKDNVMQSKIDILTEQVNKANTDIANLQKTNNNTQVVDSTSDSNANSQFDSNYLKESDIFNKLYQFNTEDNGIYFDYNSAVIKSIYYKDMLKIARRMLNDYKLKLRITGYCDSQGSTAYNKELAQKRINAIIYILVNRYRIARDRFITESVGKTDNTSEVDELSRRVDIEYFY
ncbi:MAG: OmpA family protein [Paludibacteraceae bacterium]|nr:OmpA family protein [Paludibacteraceae bacterium]